MIVERTERQARSAVALIRGMTSLSQVTRGVEIGTSGADDTEVENTPLVSGKAASTTPSARSSVHSGVSFDPKGRGPSGKDLADAPATSDSVWCGPDRQFAATCAGEKIILTEHIHRSHCATIF